MLWAVGLLTTTACAATPAEPIVKEIEVRWVGPETVNRAIITANIQTTVGQPFTMTLVEQDVRDLIHTGYFFDVRVLQEPVAGGLKVIYQVQGKASLKQVKIEGAKRLKEGAIQKNISLRPGDIYDEHRAHTDCRKVVELYQKGGWPDIKVTPEVKIDKDTGKALLVYRLEEGPRVFLKQIEFTGNRAYTTKRLQKLLKTRYRWWGSWLSNTGVIKTDQWQEDLGTLRDFYYANGYLDIDLKTNYVERVSPEWCKLHIDLFEGHQYKVGGVILEGQHLFPTSALERQLRMTRGATFTPDGLTKDTKAIEDYYGARGYLDTRVRPVKRPNIETGRLDLTYQIQEGDLTYIEKIQIRGNTKTKDKVIRRELAVLPGNIYNTVLVDRSAERLRNLGYFAKVETTPYPTQVPNRKDLVISVEEQRTGNMTFGAGFSSVDNLIGFVELTQGNFDLFNWPSFTGGGQKVRLRLQLGFERQDVVLSFTEPWFLDRRLALGVDFFHREASYISDYYTESRTGGDLRLERSLREFWRGQIMYTGQMIGIDVDNDASAVLKSQDGDYLRSSVELSLVHDSRDSVFLTLRGNRTELSAELAGGLLGGDVSVYKLQARSSWYFPFFNKHVLLLMANAGVVEAFGATKGNGGYVVEPEDLSVWKVNDVPIFDRYFLGGPNSLRGFDYHDVSPKDINKEPIGGNTSVNGTVEYTFPIVERIRGAVFFDIGNVWEESFQFSGIPWKADVGLGVRLNLPVGPLRLDYGFPVLKDGTTGDSGKIQFSVGYQF